MVVIGYTNARKDSCDYLNGKVNWEHHHATGIETRYPGARWRASDVSPKPVSPYRVRQ